MPAAHPVLAFAILAYAISWSFWLPLLTVRQGWVSWPASTYLHLWGGLGPAVAALIVTGVVDGRAGVTGLLRSIMAWRGRQRWLGLAVLYPLAEFAVAVAVARLIEGVWPVNIRHAHGSLGMPWGMVVVTSAIYTTARLGRAAGLTADVKAVLGRDPIDFAVFAHRQRLAWTHRLAAPDPT